MVQLLYNYKSMSIEKYRNRNLFMWIMVRQEKMASAVFS